VPTALALFAALILGMGVILYISAVNDEVAHRKKTESSPDNVVFEYRYGWAFFFTAATFICAMVAAVSNISQYLHRYSSMEDKLLVTGPPEAGEGKEHSGGGASRGGQVGCVYRPIGGSRFMGGIASPGGGSKTAGRNGQMSLNDSAVGNHNLSIVL